MMGHRKRVSETLLLQATTTSFNFLKKYIFNLEDSYIENDRSWEVCSVTLVVKQLFSTFEKKLFLLLYGKLC